MSEEENSSGLQRRVPPADSAMFDALSELALDMRSSWNHASDQIWRQLDPVLWELTHNPWLVLQTVSRDKLEKDLAEANFRETVDKLIRERRGAATAPAWFQQTFPQSPLNCVAYFSMEFMLSEALPIYSGGLGNVAGDQLKAASDLGIPVVGVGLLYQQGYFRQIIDRDGAQQAVFPYNDPSQLPIAPLRRQNGEWLRLQLDLPGHPIWIRVWQVQVGRTKLYLLDSNDMANYPPYRGITSELYGGGPYLRLMQEVVLGIGGWRLLAELGIEPDVCHLNEGHAALAALERARRFMAANGTSFEVALEVTRAGNLFTTHTAVEAGFDRFTSALIEQLLGGYGREQLGISLADLLALGRQNRDDQTENFNMAYLAVRASGSINGVSRLHGQVSRRLFQPLFPRWPEDEVPVGHVTNGVHMPSWDSPAADDLWTKACGRHRWLGSAVALEQQIRAVPDADLWKLRTDARGVLVAYARDRLSGELAASGAPADAVEEARRLFDPKTLTLGFARRFAAYKRPNLLLHDADRLLRLLTNAERPVQLIMAGKAHPADEPGQALIKEWMHFIRRSEARHSVIFLSDYDMLLTEQLVQGVDVWVNTPRRPWEACGTSGMKVLVNGGINLSELDGWWAEAYAPEVGWALGDGQEHHDDSTQDAVEAEALYDLLERQVVPEFYNRDEEGIPAGWVVRMRESMARLTPRFSTNRSMSEYTSQHYLPAAAAYRLRAADKGKMGAELVERRRLVDQQWSGLHFGAVSVANRDDRHVFEAQVYLEGLDPSAVNVELFANAAEGSDSVRQEMKLLHSIAGSTGGYVYGASVSGDRSACDYSARVVSDRGGLAVPLEAGRILWQR
jgi:starch phosphorylase